MADNIFLLRSQDRTSNSTSSTNFTLQLSNVIDGQYEVSYIQMYNSFYSVQAGLNDRIYWNDNSVDHTTIITSGIYSTSGNSSIATKICTLMTADSSAAATIPAAFDAVTQKLTITSAQIFVLKFGTNSTYSAAKTLGFANSDKASATLATAANPPNLGGTTSVNIRIAESDITTWNNGRGQYGSVPLPMNVSQGSLKYYSRDDFPQYIGFGRPVRQLNIQILDTTGNALFLNGTEWELAMRKLR